MLRGGLGCRGLSDCEELVGVTHTEDDIAEPKIYHHLVFLQEFGGLLGGCLTVKNEWWLLTQKMIKPLYLF